MNNLIDFCASFKK